MGGSNQARGLASTFGGIHLNPQSDMFGGLIYRRNGHVVSTGPAADINDLNPLPMPARHLLKMPLYKLGTLRGRLPFTSIQTMRGCPWKCIFCASEALKTTSMRVRSPRGVVDEIKAVVSTFAGSRS